MLKSAVLTVTPQTQRRFILGQQGLYPGRRWHGSTGVVEAIQAGSVVQVDPLNVLGRLDPKLERVTGQLLIQGFWLEDHVQVDEQFMAALTADLHRFMRFVGAETITDLTGFENLSSLLKSV